MSILYIPFGWFLRTIYEFVGSYGWALVLFTFITRFILLPGTIHQQKGSAKQLRIQPKLNKIRQKYATNQQKMQEEMQALYNREGYNPMNQGCLPLLIQLPIIWGLYGVIYKPLTYVLNIDKIQSGAVEKITSVVEKLLIAANDGITTQIGKKSGVLELTSKARSSIELYALEHKSEVLSQVQDLSQEVVDKISNFDFTFLGISMGAQPNFKEFNAIWWIPILAGAASLLTSLYTFLRQRKQNPELAKNPSMGCMMLGMPLFSIWIAFKLPAGIGMYWIITSIFSFIQTVILGYIYSPKKVVAKDMVEETIVRRSRENLIINEKNK